jgi:hypothetical protein
VADVVIMVVAAGVVAIAGDVVVLPVLVIEATNFFFVLAHLPNLRQDRPHSNWVLVQE